MKSLLRLIPVLICLLAVANTNAQYCVPVVADTGLFIGFAGFGPPYGTIPGGTNYNDDTVFASKGYLNRTGTSSATVNRNCTNRYFLSVQNCGNRGLKHFNFRIYADWNQDNDFDDADEVALDVTDSVADGNCGFQNIQKFITIPLTAHPGNIRMRWALRDGDGVAVACGGYLGEIEDYIITVTPNIAPIVDNTGTPLFAPLLETQTDNDGTSVMRLLQTTQPGVTVITETDTCPGSIKGIALISTSGTNGTWQYKTSTGAWTNVSAVNNASALLLDETCKVRFVPTSAGSAGITFRAWDKTVSTVGQYYNIASIGGTTAFSGVTETADITVYGASSSVGDVTAYLPTYSAAGGNLNILSTTFNRATSLFKHTRNITNDSTSGYGNDIVLDQATGKLYWIGGPGPVRTNLMRSNIDGTNVETLITDYFDYPSGLAIGGGKIFIADYGIGIYSANLDGSGLTRITGGEGQFSNLGDMGDIEYEDGKLFFIIRPGYEGPYRLYRMNADGSEYGSLLDFSAYPAGLDVINGNLYWTEIDGATSYIRTRTIGGETVTTLASSTDRYFYDLQVSPGNDKIYFLDANASSSDGYINSIPVEGGEPARVLVLENPAYSLVFDRDFSLLPVRFVNVKAWPAGTRNLVEWNISDEQNVNHYVVERSADGVDFTNAGLVAATHSTRYQWPDEQPFDGKTYYRISPVDNDGRQLYSSILLVNRLSQIKSMAVLPNVIDNNQLTLKLDNLTAGTYTMQVFASNGQNIFNKRITHSGGSSVQNISLPAGLSKGIYKVVVTGNNELYTTGILLH